MIELERNKPVDAQDLSEFFGRCGWQEPAAAIKLEWALAASEDWIACRLDGELVGFGRACRLGPLDRVVFDVVVDPRLGHNTLRAEIVTLLALGARRFERTLVFGQPFGGLPSPDQTADQFGPAYAEPAGPDTYIGRPASPAAEGQSLGREDAQATRRRRPSR